jgi:hypothetical protein
VVLHKSKPQQQVSLVRLFVVLFLPLGKFKDSTKNQATNASFHISFRLLKALADPKEL